MDLSKDAAEECPLKVWVKTDPFWVTGSMGTNTMTTMTTRRNPGTTLQIMLRIRKLVSLQQTLHGVSCCTRVRVVDMDGRCWKVQQALIARYKFWQERCAHECVGPKPTAKLPTRVELATFPHLTCASHSFQVSPTSVSSQTQCASCGLVIKARWKRESNASPGHGASVYQRSPVSLPGAHSTHEMYVHRPCPRDSDALNPKLFPQSYTPNPTTQ